MHHLQLNGRHKKVAENWDELSREQLLALMPVLYHKFAETHRQQIEILKILFGINHVFALRITDVQYCQILWMTHFLLGEHVGLTKQLLPSVRRAWYHRPRYGPADGLSNVRFLEFVFADAYFVAYAQGQDEQWLDKLIAVLYRPQRKPYRPGAAGYGGDRRQDFNENLVDEHAAYLARLPQAEKLAIVTWYRGCRHALELRYPLVFTPENETKATENTGGWGQVLREMSGQAFGNFDETGQQHLHTVLAKLEDDIRRAQKLQREAEAQKNSY
jgi:hypothetical protein